MLRGTCTTVGADAANNCGHARKQTRTCLLTRLVLLPITCALATTVSQEAVHTKDASDPGWRSFVDALHHAQAVANAGVTGVHNVGEFLDVDVAGLGTVRGVRGTSVDKFLGLPYAMPPIGSLRWKAPKPLQSWRRSVSMQFPAPSNKFSKYDDSAEGGTPLNATYFGPSCLSATPGGSWIHVEVEDENCLFLSVWTPTVHIERVARGEAAPLPVVVWIHGGGFIVGSSSNPTTAPPPEKFVVGAQVVYVAMNYRMGAFGFVASPAMRSYGGLFGILDQRAALQWVHDHIHDFGGNASAVTLMGESAGAISICLHLVMPLSRDLFHRAVMQSSLCSFPFEGVQSALATTRRLAKNAGCAVEHDDAKVSELLASREFRATQAHRPRSPPINMIIPEGAVDPSLDSSQPDDDDVTEAILNVTLPSNASDTVQQDVFEYNMSAILSAVADLSWQGVRVGAQDAVRRVAKLFGYTHAVELDATARQELDGPLTSGRFQHQQQTLRRPGDAYALPSLSRTQLAAYTLELQCLRTKSAKVIQRALPVRRGFMFYSGESFFPIINGIDIADHPLRLIERGLWSKSTEIILGHNKDEASVFLLFAYPMLMTEDLVRNFFHDTLGADATTSLWNQYIENVEGEVPLRTRVVRMMNDMWACASHYFAAHVTRWGGKLRYFQFQHEPSYLSPFLRWLGAFHGAELDFLFGVHQSGSMQPTLEETHLAGEMMRLWAEFATAANKASTNADRTAITWSTAVRRMCRAWSKTRAAPRRGSSCRRTRCRKELASSPFTSQTGRTTTTHRQLASIFAPPPSRSRADVVRGCAVCGRTRSDTASCACRLRRRSRSSPSWQTYGARTHSTWPPSMR